MACPAPGLCQAGHQPSSRSGRLTTSLGCCDGLDGSTEMKATLYRRSVKLSPWQRVEVSSLKFRRICYTADLYLRKMTGMLYTCHKCSHDHVNGS